MVGYDDESKNKRKTRGVEREEQKKRKRKKKTHVGIVAADHGAPAHVPTDTIPRLVGVDFFFGRRHGSEGRVILSVAVPALLSVLRGVVGVGVLVLGLLL